MPRILLPILASLALIACGNGTDTESMPGASAAAQGQAEPAATGHLAAGRTAEPTAEHRTNDAAPAAVLASGTADLANGQRQFRRCQSCHTITEGGRHTVGPNLYGVVGHPAASATGFSYSRALSAADLSWDRETLDAWIENPRELVPGNRMSFVGLRDADDRRDVIAYLASVSAQDD